MTGFTFNGTTSQSLGLLVTALNPYNSASRRVETIEIPYRNGNLIIDSGTYDNIMVSYEVSVIGNTKTTCDAVNEWLSGSQGYCILSDTVNTEFFRVGYFASSIEYVLTALYREGKATLNFDCFPQKYLNSNTTMTRNATSTTTTAEGGTFSSHVYPLPIELKGNTTQSGTPTPTSPQTIHNVSGDNSVVVCGKNMFRDYITGSITSRGVTRTGGDNCVILNGTYDQQANLDLFLTRSTSSSGTANMTLMKANTSYAISVYFLNDYSITNVTMLRVSTWSLDKTTFDWNAPGNPNGLLFDGNVAKGIYNNGNTPVYLGGIRMALTSTRTASFNNCIVKIQVEEANAVTPYEEYRGIDYNLNLPIENVLPNNITDSTVNGITVTKSDDGTLTFNGTASNIAYFDFSTSFNTTKYAGYKFYGLPSNSQGCGIRISASNSNRTALQNDLTNGKVLADTGTNCIAFRIPNGTVLDNYVLKPMLVSPINTNVKTYTPYGTSPIELNKIGNYRDYFYKSNVTGKWYVHKEIGKKYCDGTENWTSFAYGTNSWRLQDFISTTYDANKIQIMSTQFKGVANVDKNDVECMIYTDSNVLFTVRNTTYTTQRAIQQGMNGQPIYYALRTATNTEITDATLLSQLNAIDNAMAFETSTTISQVNNDAPFLLTYTNIGSATVSSNYRGEPIITVNDTGYIYINGASIKVNQVPMTINSQTMQAYNGNINLNNYIELNEFPMLKKGNNDIGSTMALSIVPNYWKL